VSVTFQRLHGTDKTGVIDPARVCTSSCTPSSTRLQSIGVFQTLRPQPWRAPCPV